jgi:hypothetical protein
VGRRSSRRLTFVFFELEPQLECESLCPCGWHIRTLRKESAGIDDKNDLDAVCYPRLGRVRFEDDAGGFVLDVLGVLGLVRYASNGDEAVTPKLRNGSA